MVARKTRKRGSSKRSGTIDVRSPSAVKSFEKLLSQGPLTLVLIYADWCGACHRFRDEVWSNLTQLKNATVNRAAVRDDMLTKTSLANVEKKFYPTLLLVGPDKKPATFPSEEGGTTNAMPRKETLEEDREALTTLVNSPNIGRSPSMPTMSVKPMSEVARSVTPGKSPFENQAKTVNVLPVPNLEEPATTEPTGPSFSPAMPPDVGADLVASQSKARTASQALTSTELTQKGGRLLRAIRNTTASLRSMLRMRHTTARRDRKTRRNRRR